MDHYEYDLLTLKQIPSPKEHDYRWHSDRQGVIGHPHEIGRLMNERGEQGWHIGTHVADGRWGNMIVLQRLVTDDRPAPEPPISPAPGLNAGGGLAAPAPDAFLLGLKEIHQSVQALTRQMAQMPPVTVTAPPPQPPVVMQTTDPQLLSALQMLQAQLAQMQSLAPVKAAPEERQWWVWLKQFFHLPSPRTVPA